ncbi:MAG: SUMF1/EgtB/PvdO family nonheme iron enzyme [Chloroflexota bacterium]|nr:SUMF1/EgtB/PvdO family nonheme iron enzyme [Chloroflexota bacterium]
MQPPRPHGTDDADTSRDEYLRAAARHETARLRSLPRSDGNAAAFRSQERFAVHLAAGGPTIEFIRVEPGSYIDGLNAALRDRIIAIPNRSNDLAQWRDMLEVHRQNRVTVSYPYYMSETIITNGMFQVFVDETQYTTTVERYKTGWIVDQRAQWQQGVWNSYQGQPWPMSAPEHPVVQVSWFDAMSFAAWVSEKAGIVCRVPTKEEWTLAARPAALADQVCTFPWGNDFRDLDKRMNFGTAELTDYTWIHEQYADGHALTSPVQAFPPNERGLYNMVGNVWVWNYTNAAAYEERPIAERTATAPRPGELGVDRNARMTMQGGCFLARVTHTTLWSKMSHPALDGAVDIGFRLVAVPGAAEW